MASSALRAAAQARAERQGMELGTLQPPARNTQLAQEPETSAFADEVYPLAPVPAPGNAPAPADEGMGINEDVFPADQEAVMVQAGNNPYTNVPTQELRNQLQFQNDLEAVGAIPEVDERA